VIEGLILVEAGEYYRFFAGYRIFVHLQALRTDFLHHALHGRVDAADGVVIGLEIGAENGVTGLLNRAHHAV
jgi:hypothetical protein